MQSRILLGNKVWYRLGLCVFPKEGEKEGKERGREGGRKEGREEILLFKNRERPSHESIHSEQLKDGF